MDEETLNIEIRKFLKKVGITSQREVEKAVRLAHESGKLANTKRLGIRMTLEVDELGLKQTITGQIGLA